MHIRVTLGVYKRSLRSHSQVFAGFYPMDQSEYPFLRTALEKLILNDSSVSVFHDSSVALGQGWRLGFLGLLHMDVFRQRLEEVCVYVCLSVCLALITLAKLLCAIRGAVCGNGVCVYGVHVQFCFYALSGI